jgi:hypothetical protein
MATQIRDFYSLKDLTDYVAGELEQYRRLVDRYNKRIGDLLRDSEKSYKDEEWFKQLSNLQKSSSTKKIEKEKSSVKKNKKSNKDSKLLDVWITFYDLQLCSDETPQGEIELLFEAIEDIRDKIDRFEKVQKALNNLGSSGLGDNVIYHTYLRNGIPEKLVLRKTQQVKATIKFSFKERFTTSTIQNLR